MCIKAIDRTSHVIYRPQVEPQETYYSGHRNYHAVHTQIIVEIIRYVESGFLGHQNDGQQFMLMQLIGRDLPFPDNCFLEGIRCIGIVTRLWLHTLEPKLIESNEKSEDNVDFSISTLEITGFVLNIRYGSLIVTELMAPSSTCLTKG